MDTDATNELKRTADLGRGLPEVCRLGLATRVTCRLDVRHFRAAIEAGVDYLNWSGEPDALGEAISELGGGRDGIVVAWQLGARDAVDATRELDAALRELRTDRIDVVTFYYIESEEEWAEINRPDGAMAAMLAARRQGKARLLGLTSHQRGLAAKWAREGTLDLLMLRYNAAHRGAERDVFPTTRRLGLPYIAYTCLRWGALLLATPDDPPGFNPPRAPEWYRFVLSCADVAVALMAPESKEELDENLGLLHDWGRLEETEMAKLRAHGSRVRKHAGTFY